MKRDKGFERGGGVRVWLELVRVPNLLAVPGDPLGGAALAAAFGVTRRGSVILPAVVAAVLLYAGGVVLNDCFDLAADRRNRPERPLPRGDVSPAAAWGAGYALLLLGTISAFGSGAAAGAVAAALAAAVLAYDGLLKRTSAAPLSMGLCRGLSVLLGAVASGWRPAGATGPLLAAGATTLYFAAVTRIARHETETRPLGFAPWLGAAGMFFSVGVIVRAAAHTPHGYALAVPAAFVAFAWGLRILAGLGKAPPPRRVQHAVGALIHGWILVQAAFCLTDFPMGYAEALLLFVFWAAARLAAETISPT